MILANLYVIDQEITPRYINRSALSRLRRRYAVIPCHIHVVPISVHAHHVPRMRSARNTKHDVGFQPCHLCQQVVNATVRFTHTLIGEQHGGCRTPAGQVVGVVLHHEVVHDPRALQVRHAGVDDVFDDLFGFLK